MNATIHCQFAAPVKFRCAIQQREPLQTAGGLRSWKPLLRRGWPDTDPAGRHNRLLLELTAPHQKPTKINS